MKINRFFDKKGRSRAFGAVAIVVVICAAAALRTFGADESGAKSALERDAWIEDGFPFLWSRDADAVEAIWRALESRVSANERPRAAVDLQLRRQGPSYKGETLRVSGRLLRCVRVALSEGENAASGYYDVWAILPDSKRDPVRIIARNAPEGFKPDAKLENAVPYDRGIQYREETFEATAIYYRSTCFNAGDDFYAAPTLVALDFAITPKDAEVKKPDANASGNGGTLVKLGGLALLAACWFAFRRRFRKNGRGRGLQTTTAPVLIAALLFGVSARGEDVESDAGAFWSALAKVSQDEWRVETTTTRPAITENAPESATRREIALTILGRISRSSGASALWGVGADSVARYSGRLASLERIELNATELERSGLDAFYRAEVDLESGERAVVYAAFAPKFEAPEKFFDGGSRADASGIGERIAWRGLAFGAENATKRATLTPRLEWTPEDAPLGRAGMDLSSFETVKVYAPTAFNNATSDEERRAIARSLRWTTDDRRAFYGALAASKHAKTFGGAEIENVAALFNRPERNQGGRISLRGWTRRVNEILVDDEEIRATSGVDSYFQIYLFNNETQGRPIILCAIDLPEDLEPGGGSNYRREIAFSGFLYKTWAFRDSERATKEETTVNERSATKGKWTTSPVLIGKITDVVPLEEESKAPVSPSAIFTSFALMALAWIVLRRVAKKPTP